MTPIWRSSSRCDSNQCVEVFFKSSYSGDNGCCVEVAFHKSSHSADTAACVEVAFHGACDCGEAVYVRDSKDPDGPRLKFTPAEWDAFLAGAKAGEFDVD